MSVIILTSIVSPSYLRIPKLEELHQISDIEPITYSCNVQSKEYMRAPFGSNINLIKMVPRSNNFKSYKIDDSLDSTFGL